MIRVLALTAGALFLLSFRKKTGLENYELSDFDSPDQKGSYTNMDKGILKLVDKLPNVFDFKPNINSAYRSPAHNLKVGGVSLSSHQKGKAVDLGLQNVDQLRSLVAYLRAKGYKRIGQYHTKAGNYFVHVDNDQDKPQSGWAYVNWGNGTGDRIYQDL